MKTMNLSPYVSPRLTGSPPSLFCSSAQSFQEFAGLLQEVERDRMMLVGYRLPARRLCIRVDHPVRHQNPRDETQYIPCFSPSCFATFTSSFTFLLPCFIFISRAVLVGVNHFSVSFLLLMSNRIMCFCLLFRFNWVCWFYTECDK